jgi:signal transduction histidine kinase
MVDSDLIKQALLNIVVNAIEAMSGAANQRRLGEGRRGTLRLRTALRNECAEVRISDTGPGIPRELREKIFNLYFTTKAHGTGIGLAMTFQIVQLHDGTIDFASEPGKGTTFIISLPVAAVPA